MIGRSVASSAEAGRRKIVRRERIADIKTTMAFLRTPLCPAGHLPRKGGDWLTAEAGAANLPPCGGDVRQDRGECEGLLRLILTVPLEEGTRAGQGEPRPGTRAAWEDAR